MKIKFEAPDKDDKYPQIEPGKYTVKAIKWEDKTSKSGDKKYIGWQLRITGENKFNGRVIFFNTMYSGTKFTGQLVAMLQSINPDFNYLDANGEFDPDEFIGKPFEVDLHYTIDATTNSDSKYPSIKKCYPFVSDLGDFNAF